ncbi:PH domain-containing protein [Rummeliibacillus sp. NPDC094406]
MFVFKTQKTIPLESIKSIKKTMNPLSSPALSLKRLDIEYGQYQNVLYFS